MFGLFNKKKKKKNLDEAIKILTEMYEEIGINYELSLKMSFTNLSIAESFTNEKVFSPLVLVINAMSFHRAHFISQINSGETDDINSSQRMIDFYTSKISELLSITKKMNLTDSELVSIMQIEQSLNTQSNNQNLPKNSSKVVYADSATYSSYDEWLSVYKMSAASVNPQLVINEDGTSLIDFMDDEPTRRAFNDNVDPEYLGVEFGNQFDLQTFGQE